MQNIGICLDFDKKSDQPALLPARAHRDCHGAPVLRENLRGQTSPPLTELVALLWLQISPIGAPSILLEYSSE